MTIGKRIAVCFLALAYTQASVVYAAPLWPRWFRRSPRPSCETALESGPEGSVLLAERQRLAALEALRIIHDETPSLLRRTGQLENPPPWVRVLNQYLWPFVNTRSKQLAISIVGPGNSGKSTIFNSIPRLFEMGQNPSHVPHGPDPEISKVDFTAGKTGRPVIMMNTELHDDRSPIERRFGILEQWHDAHSTTETGGPVVYPLPNFFKNLVFIDTPPMDLHGREPMSDKVFQWSDIMFYVFSGMSYKNEAVVRLMRQKFQEIGARQVVLIYRVHGSISEAEAASHFHDVAEALFPAQPNDPNTHFPFPVIGTYLMHDSENVVMRARGPEFTPFGNTPELFAFLEYLERHSDDFRRKSLESSLQYVLDGVSDSLNRLQMRAEEWVLVEKAFDLLLSDSVHEYVKSFPYHRLGKQLEEILYNRSRGIRNFAQWWAYPIRMLRGRRTEVQLQGKVLQEMDTYLSTLVDQILTKFLFSASRAVIRIPISTPGYKEFARELEEFRTGFNLGPNEAPYMLVHENMAEIYLSRQDEVHREFEDVLRRDWTGVTADVKREVREQLSALTLQIQSQFDEILGGHSLTQRMVRGFYLTMAVMPAAIALVYLLWNEKDIASVNTIASLVGAHLLAKGFVYLDHRNRTHEWDEIINKWFADRQTPRILDILRARLRVRTEPIHPTTEPELDRLQMAVEALGNRSLPMDSHRLISPDSP